MYPQRATARTQLTTSDIRRKRLDAKDKATRLKEAREWLDKTYPETWKSLSDR